MKRQRSSARSTRFCCRHARHCVGRSKPRARHTMPTSPLLSCHISPRSGDTCRGPPCIASWPEERPTDARCEILNLPAGIARSRIAHRLLHVRHRRRVVARPAAAPPPAQSCRPAYRSCRPRRAAPGRGTTAAPRLMASRYGDLALDLERRSPGHETRLGRVQVDRRGCSSARKNMPIAQPDTRSRKLQTRSLSPPH